MGNGRKHKYLGLCISKIQEYTQSDFFHAVAKRAVERGYKLLIFNSFSDLFFMNNYDTGESKIFNLIPYDMLSGLIFMSETVKNDEVRDKIAERAKAAKLPLVSVDRSIEGCFNITFDYRKAFEEIVRHVITVHGCRVINLVAGVRNNPFSDERIECCRRIMEEYGLTLEDERIMYGDFWSDPTARAFDEFMASGLPMPDAFICCNDSMAITVCAKLKDCGKSVPGDVIVTGFDGIFAERYHIPRLTTAKQGTELAGIAAVDAAADMAEGRSDGCMEKVIDHQVTYSHSCGCKRIDYREATGQITPLFNMADYDNGFDNYMYDFSAAAAEAKTPEELGEIILNHSGAFGVHYYGLALNEDFMNISDTYDDMIGNHEEALPEDENRGNHLILCECTNNRHFPPVFSETPPHMNEAADRYNVFLLWSVHFQEKYIGYGVMALSTGCDGLTPNDDLRHIVKYTRHLGQVLQIANSQAGLEKIIARLQDLYIRDHITGLYNRRGFYNDINKRISDPSFKGKYIVIISIDMDGLKFINDTYGHAEGDVAIKAISAALISIWGENEVCSRFGGDEFTVASFAEELPIERAKDIISRIKQNLDRFNSCSGKPYMIGSSFGFHYEKIDGEIVLDNIIKVADNCMYKEKATHKNSRYRKSPRE